MRGRAGPRAAPARKQRLLAGRVKPAGARSRSIFPRRAGPARRRATRRSRGGTPLRRAARARHGWRGAIPCARGGGQAWPPLPAPHDSATGSLSPDNGGLPGRLRPTSPRAPGCEPQRRIVILKLSSRLQSTTRSHSSAVPPSFPAFLIKTRTARECEPRHVL